MSSTIKYDPILGAIRQNDSATFVLTGNFDFSSLSSNWQNTYTTVASNSSKWENVYSTVNLISSNWSEAYTDIKNLSSNWQDIYSIVQSNSSIWSISGGTGGGSDVSTLSANWQNTWTTVASNSSTWGGSSGSDVSTLSSNWQNTYNTVTANSATWGSGSVTAVHSIEESYTIGENVVSGNVLYIKSDGKYWKANATNSTKVPALAISRISANAEASIPLLFQGSITNTSWSLTPGGIVYLSTSDGVITQTQPSATDNVIQTLGVAVSSNKIYFKPSLVYLTHI